MPLDTTVSIHGIVDIGEFTATSATAGGATKVYNADNVYTETSWGLTSQEGARIVPSVTSVKQRSGQSPLVRDSFISEVDGQLQLKLIDGQLQTLKRMMGLPDSKLTGDLGAATPTKEVLRVHGPSLGTVERGIYIRTMGPVGPRTYYIPRAKAISFPEQAASSTEYFEPNCTMDLYGNDDEDLYWIEDAAA